MFGIDVCVKTKAPGKNPHIHAIQEVLNKHGVQHNWQYRGDTHCAIVSRHGYEVPAVAIEEVRAMEFPPNTVTVHVSDYTSYYKPITFFGTDCDKPVSVDGHRHFAANETEVHIFDTGEERDAWVAENTGVAYSLTAADARKLRLSRMLPVYRHIGAHETFIDCLHNH